MNADLEIALVGLGGVIVGAVITSGFSYVMERRKERREVRRAARLIDAELLNAEVSIRTCMEDSEWWSKTAPLTSEAWQEHRAVIASSELSSDDWLTVRVAVMAANAMQEARDGALAIQLAELARDQAAVVAVAERFNMDIVPPAPAIPEDHSIVPTLEPSLRRVRAGRAVLATLM